MTDLMEPLTETIRTIRSVIKEHEDHISKSETRTRNVLVDPLLRALGWDVSLIEDVQVEYVTMGRKKVDYALLSTAQDPLVLVEAKKLNATFDSTSMSQLLSYCLEVGARYGVRTDGNCWEMYDTTQLAPIYEKRTLFLVLTSQDPAIAARMMLDLWKAFVRAPQPPAKPDRQ